MNNQQNPSPRSYTVESINAIVVDVMPTSMVEANLKTAVKHIASEISHESVASIDSLALAFGVGLVTADFVVELAKDEVHFPMVTDNLEDLYHPLHDVLFTDVELKPIPAGSLIALRDIESSRRNLVIVLEPGNNVIIYDRHPYVSGAGTTLRMSIGMNSHLVREVLGLDYHWTEGTIHDLVMIARLFGFEYNRAEDTIVIPLGRPDSRPGVNALMAIVDKDIE